MAIFVRSNHPVMKKILFLSLFFHCAAVLPQNGSIDQTFDVGSGADQNVYIAKQLHDGKIIVGGQFIDYGSTGRRNLVRLNADGSIDQTFNSPPDLDNYTLLADAIEDDGKLVVAGQFGMFNGVMSPGIVRLNSDGSIDTTFNVGTGINGGNGISNLSRQGDKYIITGNFSSYNDTQCGNILRLNHDGTIDETFPSLISNFGFNVTITDHEILPDGKIMIVGNFTSHNGVPFNGIARLDANGAVDTTFNPGAGANAVIISIAAQTDGKYIIGGMFSAYDNIEKLLLARVNPDGTLDATFSRSPEYGMSASNLMIQPDGKIIATGFLTGLATVDKYIFRLNTDGSIDPGFDSDIDNVVNAASFQDNGKILVGGWFEHAGSQAINRVARLQNDGFLSVREFPADASIYPNPVSHLVHIDFGRYEDYSVTVFDLGGKELHGSLEKAETQAIDFSGYRQGVYLLRIESTNGTTIKKIIKN